jgi:hypothetical protein
MNESAEYRDAALEAFNRVVRPYLRKKLGSDLAALLTDTIRDVPPPASASVKDAFVQLCRELLETRLNGYEGPFLSLVLDRDELASLMGSFERDYESLYGENRDSLAAGNVFDRLLAPDLVDVLGEELVTYLKQLYIDEIEIQVGVADHQRFLAAMEKLAETVPLLHEAEYMERIRGIAEILKKQQTDSLSSADDMFSAVSLEDGIEQIIIPDLADILGKGPILESLVEAAREQCSGIFPDELARFSRFVKELNKSDIILNMFGDHWTAGKEQEWIEAFRKMVVA